MCAPLRPSRRKRSRYSRATDRHDPFRPYRYVCARSFAAGRAMAGLFVQLAGTALSGPAELRQRIRRRLDRRRARRPRLPDRARRKVDLCRAGGTGQSHRQRADARSRRGAGKSRAAARSEQSDDGRRLFRRDQSRRRRGRDHAAVARQGNRIPGYQGRDQACIVRRAAVRRDGENQAARAGAEADRLLGPRHGRQPRTADDATRLRAVRRPAIPQATTCA